MTDKFTHPNDAPEGHEWQTRDGREVTQVVVLNAPRSSRPIRAVVDGDIQAYHGDGRQYDVSRRIDLIDKPEKPREWWDVLDPWGKLLERGLTEGLARNELERNPDAQEVVHVREVFDAD